MYFYNCRLQSGRHAPCSIENRTLSYLFLRFFLVLRHRKAHRRRKQIRVRLHPEAAATGLGEAFGDRQPQSAAAVRPALIAPDEALGEINAVAKLGSRCIFS